MASKIVVEGRECVVKERLGYQPSAGVYAAIVWDDGETKAVVRRSPHGLWRFWMPEDRLGRKQRPL